MKRADKHCITGPQLRHLMFDFRNGQTGQKQDSLWSAACRTMGWNKNDRQLRLDTFSRVLGRRINSASEIGKLKEFDVLKAHLLALARPADLDAQLQQVEQPVIRLRFKIRELAGEEYIARIARDKFGTADLDQLNALQLEQLRNTLCARTIGEVAVSAGIDSGADPY